MRGLQFFFATFIVVAVLLGTDTLLHAENNSQELAWEIIQSQEARSDSDFSGESLFYQMQEEPIGYDDGFISTLEAADKAYYDKYCVATAIGNNITVNADSGSIVNIESVQTNSKTTIEANCNRIGRYYQGGN